MPEIVSNDNSILESVALDAHRSLFKSPKLHPTSVHTIRWTDAIPRYRIGHWEKQEKIRHFHQTEPLLRLSGNHLFGVAVKDCIRVGREHAHHFIHTLSPKA